MTDTKRQIARESVCFEARFELQTVTTGHFMPSQVAEYWADVLHGGSDRPKDWCGAFALYCLHRAGLGVDLSWQFGPPHYGFLWYLQQLPRGTPPEPGDVGYQDIPYRHHFLVEAVDGHTVHTIEGNQGPLHPIRALQRQLHDAGVVYFSIARILPLEGE